MTSNDNPKELGAKSTQTHSYILRFWQDEPQGPWRIMLLETRTNERHGFPSLEKLFHYLSSQMEIESHQIAGRKK